MNTLKHSIRAFRVLAAWILLSAPAHGQTTCRLSTSFLARGEQALLEISVAGGLPNEIPTPPKIKNIAIQASGRGPQTRILPGRRLEYVFDYIVSGYETGKYAIPPVEVVVDGGKVLTEPLDFVIFNPDELQWSEVEAGGKTIRRDDHRGLGDSGFRA
jgi:hypothetical protein